MQPRTLDQWLQWQTVLHDKAIDLGLERVRQVAQRLGIERIAASVITVAGTNGKGSTVAVYEHWLRQSGYRVASYTSPHLLRYNERIKLDTEPVADAELCNAFAAVEAARADTALTYFEFGTLAALLLMQQWQPDYAVLEVGLGGRLDAVNIVDADLVHLTPVALDHQAFLGDTREQIGYEKAGVLRPGVAVVLNDPEPPQSVIDEIDRLECRCLQLGRDYEIEPCPANRLRWRGPAGEHELEPVLPGAHQVQNLAGVVAGLSLLLDLNQIDARQFRANFRGTRIPGRFQRVSSALAADVYLDVGHNPAAARALATNLAALRRDRGRVVVLLGMLEDKRAAEFVTELQSVVDGWWLLSLATDRGLSAQQLCARVQSRIEVEQMFDDIDSALDHALSSLGNQDIMLVTGSFVTVEMLARVLSPSD